MTNFPWPEPLLIANEAFEHDCARRAVYEYTSQYLLWEGEEGRIRRREQHQIVKSFFPDGQLNHDEVALCRCENDGEVKCASRDCRNFFLSCICPAQCGPNCMMNPFATNMFEGYRNGALELRHDKEKGWGVFAKIFILNNKWLAPYLGRKRYPHVGDRFEDNCYTMELAGTNIMIDAKESGNFTRLINHDIKDANVKAATYRFKNQLITVLYTIQDIHPGQELLLNYEYNEDQEGVANEAWIIKSFVDAHDAGIDVSEYTRMFDVRPVPEGSASDASDNQEPRTSQGAAPVRPLIIEQPVVDSEFVSEDDPDERTAGKKKKATSIFNCFKCLKCKQGNKKAKSGKKGKKANRESDPDESFPLLERTTKKAARRNRKGAPSKSSSPRPGTSNEQNSPRQTRSMTKNDKKDK